MRAEARPVTLISQVSSPSGLAPIASSCLSEPSTVPNRPIARQHTETQTAEICANRSMLDPSGQKPEPEKLSPNASTEVVGQTGRALSLADHHAPLLVAHEVLVAPQEALFVR